MSKLQVALIGCGGRGLGHVRVLQEFDDVDMVAVVIRSRLHEMLQATSST